jgi:HlyD family secretion protein
VEVAQIVPSGAPLQVKASVSPQERNRLKAGQKVHMRVSACPYPDYGTLKGVVSTISEDTLKLQADNIPAFYEVTIKPERYFLSHGDKKCSIQLGLPDSCKVGHLVKVSWSVVSGQNTSGCRCFWVNAKGINSCPLLFH